MAIDTNKMTLGDITEVLEGMEDGDIITFANGAIAFRHDDLWEITLPGGQ